MPWRSADLIAHGDVQEENTISAEISWIFDIRSFQEPIG